MAGQRETSKARSVIRRLQRRITAPLFPGSEWYWKRHYRRGGDSGVGSGGHLATFKAGTIDALIAELGIESVVELGCGDGRQVALASYQRYLGLDISPDVIGQCATRFADDPTKSFLVYDPRTHSDPARFVHADLALSLDVLFHLVEQELFEAHLRHLFAAADRAVIIYAADARLTSGVPYSLPRPFTPWVAANLPGWRLDRVVRNPWPEESWSDLHLFLRDPGA